MADLQMAQLPQFGVQQSGVPYQGNMGTGAAAGASQAMNAFQAQQAIQQKQQEMAQMKHEKMLEVGADMLINGGDDAQDTAQGLIRQAVPFLTGQPMPPNVPIDKPLAKNIQYYHNATKLYAEDPTNPLALSPKDAVAGFTQDLQRKSLKQQTAQMDILKADPMYKEAMADQTGGQVNGQPATQNSYTGNVSDASGKPMPGAQGNFVTSGQAATIQNEKAQSLKSTFMEASKDFQQIAPDYRDFSTLMSQPMPADTSTMTPQDKQNAVTNQKAALLKYVQLNVPASRRPPNMSSLETMAQGGELPQQAQQFYNQLFETGAPLTGKMVNSLRATATKTYLSAEAQQTQIENSWAQNAKANGVDPSTVVQNFRPSTAVSSSQFFPSQGQGLLGQTVNFKGKTLNGKKMLVGHDPKNPDNYVDAE